MGSRGFKVLINLHLGASTIKGILKNQLRIFNTLEINDTK